MRLPFYGTWMVAQGYEGSMTHKGSWKHALDFVITNQEGKQFKDKGDLPEDYFCYNKPVLAPADGYIESVIDNIDDNIIGKPNIRENWGNTVIIKHDPHTYSSLSHLRKGSVTVKSGDRVRQGDFIGKCGNSGRSPYPHLHFQVQTVPYIGSYTKNYPMSYYMEQKENGFELRNYSVPAVNQGVSNIQTNELLVNAFDLVPGKSFCFKVVREGKSDIQRWEVDANEFNIPFIKCLSSGSIAYFSNDGNLFMFRHYEGKKDTLLYFFFLAAFNVPQGFYRGIQISDRFPLNLVMNKYLLFLQDFTAPFIKFIRSEYSLVYEYIDNELMTTQIHLASSSVNYFARKKTSQYDFTIAINENGISAFTVKSEKISITATSCDK